MEERAPYKLVCQLDEKNIFIGMSPAYLNSLADDESYLIPRGCIDVPEPELKEGFALKWSGENWEYIEDHRGKVVYLKENGEKTKITELGALPDTVTLIAPVPYSEWSESANNWVEKPNADELRILDRRINAGSLNRNQILTELEIRVGFDKDKLVEIANERLEGVRKIKIRNIILEGQVFNLDNDDLWQFFTETLNIEPEKLFEFWEEAKNNY